MFSFWLCSLLAFYLFQSPTLSAALPTKEPVSLAQERDLFGYAPHAAFCPFTPLVRQASGLSSSESAWFAQRKANADANTKSWLTKFDGTFAATQYPTIGLSVAGGSIRAALTGAGLHKAFSATESKSALGGLYDSLSYETTLSGSTWYLGGVIQNNWPPMDHLLKTLWEPAYANGLAAPGGVFAPINYNQIISALSAKALSGYPPTFVDAYGLAIAYSSLTGLAGGIGSTMSDVRFKSKFADATVPMPIMTSIGTDVSGIWCTPPYNATQYEFTPFEFGSWDEGVAAFSDVMYLGTKMNNGKPAGPFCTQNFDNLAWIMASASNILGQFCANLDPSVLQLQQVVRDLIFDVHNTTNRVWYGSLPNPFQGYGASPLVSGFDELRLLDGATSYQLNPVWPIIRRNVDVFFALDSGYDDGTYPTGSEIHQTYIEAQQQGVTSMPVVPDASVFKAKGLLKRPVAFGCNDMSKSTMIYLPLQNFTYISPHPTQIQQPANVTDLVLENGYQVATYGGAADWPQCVACLIMKKKATSLPSYCRGCFTKYCYN